MNGVEIGRYIRENLNDEIVQIAYISADKKYAMELFEYRPINFLVKPLNYNVIKKVIDKYLAISEQSNHVFSYKKGFKIHKISISDIMYFENNKRKVKVVMKEGSDEFYDSMENIYSVVKSHKFFFVHKSFIVNYNAITIFGYDEVTILGGIVIPISQSRRKEIRKKYMEIKMEET